MSTYTYNPWHGCKKYSEGCLNCYVYRRDESIGKDASIITKTSAFKMPVSKDRQGNYKIKSGSTLYCCMTSDFFVEEADIWREDVWKMIKERSDCNFIIFTKRIIRFEKCIPEDWNDGYDNVRICCTMENQRQCDIRLPIFLKLPIKHKEIVCEPLLSDIDFHNNLQSIEEVSVGGESGENARICEYGAVLHIRKQCYENKINFSFHQTGACLKKDGIIYNIDRKNQHSQAKKANIDIHWR